MKARRWRTFVVSILATGLIAPALVRASDYLGYVQSVVQIGNTVWVYLGAGHFGTSSCGASALILYFDPTTATGQSYLALSLSAKLAGTQVYATGNGVCYVGNTPNGSTSEAMAVMWQE